MSSRNCSFSIRRMHKTCKSTWLCPRDARRVHRRRRRRRKIGRIALASDCRPDPRTELALLICRARDVARTARHARHTSHATRTRNAITRRRRTRNSNSRSGNLRFCTPNLRFIIVYCQHFRFFNYCFVFSLCFMFSNMFTCCCNIFNIFQYASECFMCFRYIKALCSTRFIFFHLLHVSTFSTFVSG